MSGQAQLSHKDGLYNQLFRLKWTFPLLVVMAGELLHGWSQEEFEIYVAFLHPEVSEPRVLSTLRGVINPKA